jgi:NADH-quinone oxidoreductase subunit F
LKEYQARGGCGALAKAVKAIPEDIIEEVSDAGLRGAVAPASDRKEVVFHTRMRRTATLPGDERRRGRAGKQKDRMLMENLPHLVIEGVILAAYAIAHPSIPLHQRELRNGDEVSHRCVGRSQGAGYWWETVLGSDFSLDIEIIPAPHNYVAGEDTATLEVIEGKKPWPRQKPPFPVTVGLFGKPTAVNNVETLANVPPILLHGAEWYRGFGTSESPGTMIFSLNDDVNRPGIYELPFGTPLRYLIEECGGGMKGGKKIKAIMPRPLHLRLSCAG